MEITPRSHPPQPAAGSGCVLAAFTLLLCVGIIHGVLAFGCYLINELRRLSDFEIAMLWLGDVIGVFWFLRYVVRRQFGMIDESPRRLANARFPKTAWVMLASMGIGFVSELAMTLSLQHEEYAGFARAVPATCFLQTVASQEGEGAVYWRLAGEYQDAAGTTHPVTYYVRESDEMQKLPGPTVQAIRQGQIPLPLPIVYDPERPGRSWIPQLGWDDGNRLHYFSLLILLFQFLLSMLFVILLHDSIKSHNHLPWWTELHSLIPLGTQAFILALFGGVELYIVRRFCP